MAGKNCNTVTRSNLKFKSSTSPIGLDIGSAQIKVIQLRQKAGALSCTTCFTASTPSGAISEGRIIDQEKLSYKLGQIKKKLTTKNNLANICLGPESHYLRIISLPPLSKKDLLKTLPWEVEKHFPLKAVNASYDCCPLNGSKTSGNGSRYILAAAETETADILAGVVEKAGFVPLSMEVNPLSLLRVETVNRHANPPNFDGRGKALLDIGYRCSTLLLTVNGTLHYCRYLRFGVFDFLKEASSDSGINPSEAHRLNFNFLKPVTASATKSSNILAEQITASIGYYLDQSASGKAEPGLLAVSGGGAVIPGLIGYLQSKLSIKVGLQQLPALNGLCIGGITSVRQNNPAVYTTAFGLALRGWLR